MALTDILNIAGSGMNAQVVRMNTTASNLANAGVVSTTEEGAFRARRPVFEAILSSISEDPAEGGVRVTDIVSDGSSPKRVYEPGNPAADDEGYVYASNVNEVAELIEMLDASRAYQNNVEVVTATRNLLSSTLGSLKDEVEVCLYRIYLFRLVCSPRRNMKNNKRKHCTRNKQNLDRDDFLVLFTTQLKNQNPLDPLENEAFVAQLAQFSSLESMKGMQQTMDDMAKESKSDKFLLGANLLGRTVSVEGGQVLAGGGNAVTLKGIVDSSLTDAVFRIYDAETGGLVHEKEMSDLGWRGFSLEWTGEDSSGQPYPESIYQFSLIANNGEEKVAASCFSAKDQLCELGRELPEIKKSSLMVEVNCRWNSLVTLKFRTGEN